MTSASTPSRRAFITGQGARRPPERYHVSSAVVAVLPGRMASVMRSIAKMPGAEIGAHNGHRLVVVMEAASTDELGGLLTVIGRLDGVIAASMVFEQIEDVEGA